MKINFSLLGCPLAPVYKGAKGRGRPAKEGAPRGSPTPTGSRTPSFLVQLGERGERRGVEKEGRGGPRPKLLVQSALGLGGARATSWLLPTKAH